MKVNARFVIGGVMFLMCALIILLFVGIAFSSHGDDQWRALGVAGVSCLPCLLGLMMLEDALQQ
jgi:hypothetical protein